MHTVDHYNLQTDGWTDRQMIIAAHECVVLVYSDDNNYNYNNYYCIVLVWRQATQCP